MDFAAGLTRVELDRGWAGLVGSYYHGFLRAVAGTGRLTYAVGYDWRQDILQLADFFVQRLRELEVSKDFLVVTHSMGGLVFRAALASQKGLQQRVRGVVHLCQPCHGAAVLYRRIFTGCQAGPDGRTVVDRLLCQILGTSGTQFLTNLCGLPGAMQLLPTEEFEYPGNTKLTG
jgi:pimeloyl-ACP methyl ester carboxylesterase